VILSDQKSAVILSEDEQGEDEPKDLRLLLGKSGKATTFRRRTKLQGTNHESRSTIH
jgi:hypothetical protein